MMKRPLDISPNQAFGLPLHSAGPYAATYALKDKVFPYVMIKWGTDDKFSIFSHCDNRYCFALTGFDSIPDAIDAMKNRIASANFDPNDLADLKKNILHRMYLKFSRYCKKSV